MPTRAPAVLKRQRDKYQKHLQATWTLEQATWSKSRTRPSSTGFAEAAGASCLYNDGDDDDVDGC